MTNEEAAIKIAEELAVKEANRIDREIRKEMERECITKFLQYVGETTFRPIDLDLLDEKLEEYLK